MLALAAASAAFGATEAPAPQRAHQLDVQAQRFETRAQRALLDVYSFDARLATARARLASLEEASGRLHAQQTLLREELVTDRATLKVSQHELGDRLRTLYEQGSVDPLAVVLGAQSLGQALGRLEDLKSVADESKQVVAATTAAQRRLARTRRLLASHARLLARSLRSAREITQSLARTAAARLSYVASLRNQAQLRRSQVRDLLLAASSAGKKSQHLQPTTTPPSAAPAPTGGRKLTVSATCYDLSGTTATGMPVGWGIVAVDPSLIPLGTKMYVPGYGKGVAADVGGGIKGAVIDLWMPAADCMKWGRRTVTITLY